MSYVNSKGALSDFHCPELFGKANEISIVAVSGESCLPTESSLPEVVHQADRFFTIWHEFAHAAGANEPQADMMAAVVTRQAFHPSNTALQNFADQRAIHAVMGFEDEKIRHKYGWGVVDANDYIASLPDERILGISEEQIKNLCFQKFDPLADTIYKVGRAFKENTQNVFVHANTTFRDDVAAQYVCNRFTAAWLRSVSSQDSTASEEERAILKEEINSRLLSNEKYPSFIHEPEI